jgi:hypothetical protein
MSSDEFSPRFGPRSIDATTVAVSGEVDARSAPELAVALADRDVDRVMLTAVTFIDAAGLAVLLESHRSRSQGVDLVLAESVCAPTARPHRPPLHVPVRRWMTTECRTGGWA